MSDALKAAGTIINRLGQVSSSIREPSSENIHHLPSQGSLIPTVVSDAAPTDASMSNGISAQVNQGLSSEKPSLGYPQVTTGKDMSAEEVEARVHVPWELFGMELSEFCEFDDYIPLLGV